MPLRRRHGASYPAPVAFAQIMRIALLVLIVPTQLLVAIDGKVTDPATLTMANGPVDYFGALLFLAIALRWRLLPQGSSA